jgi:hypothetical protein
MIAISTRDGQQPDSRPQVKTHLFRRSAVEHWLLIQYPQENRNHLVQEQRILWCLGLAPIVKAVSDIGRELRFRFDI